MSSPNTLQQAMSEIDRLQKLVEVLRESLGHRDLVDPWRPADQEVDHRESARILRELIEGTDPATGTDFFPSLVQHLAAALQTKYAVVWTFVEGDRSRMRSLAVWAGTGFGENFEGPIPGSPCERTVETRRYCAFPTGVRQQFPEVAILAALGIESYFAAPLFDRHGDVLGNLVVMDDQSKQLTSEQQSILELFAGRAGSEWGRQRAEREVKRSEAYFRALIEQALDIVTVLSPDGTVRYQSPSLERVVGWRPEERVGRHAFEHVHPDDLELGRTTLRAVLERPGEIRTGEFRLRHRNGSWRTLEAVGRATTDHDGDTCVIVNMRDITERKRVEQERLQALHDLHNIMETVPDFMFTLDTKGNLIQWNSRVSAVTGYRDEELLNKPALEFVPTHEQEPTAAAIQRAFTEGYAELDGHLCTKDGCLIPYHWTGAVLKNLQGELIGITGVGRDVSERKRTEAEIRRQREHLITAQALAHLGSWKWEIETGAAAWSDELFRIFGHEPGGIATTYDSFLTALHPEDHDRVLAAVNGALVRGKPYDVECRILRPSGEVRTIHCRGTVDRNAAGDPVSMEGTVLDVTDRKQIEEALRASEERWHLAVHGSNDGIWDWNVKTGEVFFSSRWKAIRGFGDGEIRNHVDEWRSRIHPDDLDRVLQRLDAYLNKQAPEFVEEYRVLHKGGSYRWVLDRGVAVWSDTGVPLRMAGSESDITERKRTEAALRTSEERLRLAMDIAQLATWDWNIRTNQILWSDNCEAVKRLPAGSFEGTFEAYQRLVHPEDLPRLKQDIDRALASRNMYYTEHRLIPPNGEVQWVEGNGLVCCDEMGNPVRMVGTVRNITERKQAEEALRRSEAQLRQALQASNTGLWEWNTESNGVSFSREWKRQLGYEEPELPDTFATWESSLHPEDHDRAMAYVSAYLAEPNGDYQQEFRLRHKDGTYRWIAARASFIAEPDGRRVRLLGSHTDITDRKRGEEQLRLTQFTMDRLSEAIFWISPDARIAYVNDAACRMLGYTRDELVSMSVPEIDPNFPGEAWLSHWEELKQRGSFTFESSHRTKAGMIFQTEVTVNHLQFDGQEFNCAVMRDITERKRAEEALRESHERLEQALEASHTGTWRVDLKSGLDRRDASLNRLLGLPAIPTMQSVEDWFKYAHPDDVPSLRAAWDLSLTTGVYDAVHRILRRDGGMRWVHDRGVVCVDEAGRPLYAIGAVHDITERKQAEEALRASEELFSKAFRSSPDPMVLVELDSGRWLDVNDACLAGLGHRRDEVIGRTGDEIGHWISAAERRRFVQQLKEAGSVRNFEGAFQTATGERCDCLVSAELIEYHGTRCMIVLSKDITERKRAEESLDALVRGTASVTGHAFFPVFVKELAAALDVTYAAVTDIVGNPPSSLKTRALWVGDKWGENFEYPLANTPCEPVIREGLACYPSSVQQLFPHDPDLVTFRAESYLGILIRGEDGKTLGHIFVIDVKPLADPKRATSILQVFAARAAAELERLEAEEALVKSERQLRTVLDALPVGVWFTDQQGHVLYGNPAGHRIWSDAARVGLPQRESSTLWWEAIDSSKMPHRWAIGTVMSRGEAALNEKIVIENGGGERRTIMNSSVPVKGVNGKILGALLLNEDITERVQAEQALRQNHALLSAIMDASVDLIYVKDLNGRYVHMNQAGAKVLGMPVDEIVGWDDVALWGSELAASCLEADRQVLASGQTITAEECDTTHGKPTYYLTTKAPYRDPEGRIIGIIGVSRDITERKQTELERVRQYEELQAIFRMTLSLSHAASLEEVYEAALDGVERALKTDRASILSFDDQGLMRFRASRGLSETYRRAVEGESPWAVNAHDPQPVLVENTATDPVETYRELFLAEGIRAVAFVPLVASDRLLGKFMLYYNQPHRFREEEIKVARTIAGHIAFMMQRAQAADELRASQELFKTAFRSSPNPMVLSEMETGRCLDVNDVALSLFGYRYDEVIGKGNDEIGHWPSQEHRRRFVERLKQEGAIRNLEGMFRTRGGEFRQCLVSAERIELQGVPCMIVAGNDITEWKQAEDALRMSEERFAKAFQSSPNPIVIAELESGLVIDANEAAYRLFEYQRNAVEGNTTVGIGLWPSPEDRRRFVEAILRDGSLRNYEVTLRTSTGKERTCLLSSEIIEIHGRRCVLTIGNDITEQKRADAALRTSEERYRSLVDNAPIGIFVNEGGRFVYVNQEMCRILGASSPEQLLGMSVLDRIAPAFHNVVKVRIKTLTEQNESVPSLDEQYMRLDGSLVDVAVKAIPTRLDGIPMMQVLVLDITERMEAEAALRRSHTFIRQVIDIDPNFIFAKDREGQFTLVNKAVADAYGTTVNELIGKTDADFNPNRDEVEFFRQKDLEVMDSLQERFIPEEVITDAEGKTRWLQTVKRPILDDQGRATMVLGASTDITKRKQAEEALLQRERDLRVALEERERISQDLHDGILQSLYAVGLSIETCRPPLKKFRAKKVAQTLDRVVMQLNGVMGEVRAFIAGLETELWRKQDLTSAIKTMVETLAQPHEAHYRVAIDPVVSQALTPEQGMHLFSIVKEAVSNSLRHARARLATVSLRSVKAGVRLTVRDNGIGFVPSQVGGTGHGLANMASRATRLGGQLAIQSKPSHGTRVVLNIPKEKVHA